MHRYRNVLISIVITILHINYADAAGVQYTMGDVFAGVGGGIIKHFNSNGTLLDTLNTGAGSTEDTGMAFDASHNLYATVFQANNVYKFDNQGNLLGSFGRGYNLHPESLVFDQSGNVYVGQADGTGQVLKFSSDGALLGSFSPSPENRGTDWIDLASDQCTLHYTSEGNSIEQFNVCRNAALPAFATGLNGPCYAHRIRPNSEELVACTRQAYRLNSSGGVIQTYIIPGASFLFALNLDPDNKSFWTADYTSGNVFRIDIATGALITQFNAGIVSSSIAGLAVAGEITAATAAPPPTTSYYVTTRKPSTLMALGKTLAQTQLTSGTTAEDSVITLLFGAPIIIGPGVSGASQWGNGSSLSDVAKLVENFITGYYNALGTNTTLHTRVVIATSNSGKNITFAQGQAWATLVNNVASWVITLGYSGQVDVAGGTNIEPDFNGPAVTRQWVDGYASVKPSRFLYNIGTAEGCVPNVNCLKGWTEDDLWYVSWGADPAQLLPEVYNATMASDWAQLSLYGFMNPNRRNGGSVIMAGTLTEMQACAQNPSDNTCKPIPFSPAQGWQSLYEALKKNPHTAQTLSWSTDIKWSPN